MSQRIENLAIRGLPEDFLKIKVSTILIKMVYPAILGIFLQDSKSVEETQKRLSSIGYRTAEVMGEFYTPAGKKVKDLVFNISKDLWGIKPRIIYDKKEKLYRIQTRHCPLCKGLPPMEIEGIHYCYPVPSYIEATLNTLASHRADLPFKRVKCQPSLSMGSGANMCEYIVQVEGER